MIRRKFRSDARDSFLAVRVNRNYNHKKIINRELKNGFIEKIFRWMSYEEIHVIILIQMNISAS